MPRLRLGFRITETLAERAVYSEHAQQLDLMAVEERQYYPGVEKIGCRWGTEESERRIPIDASAVLN